ncbi:Coronin-2B [Globomyces sp. JEL0801]|nr:Coronin-2B [Globomyces sp. JEL0801]
MNSNSNTFNSTRISKFKNVFTSPNPKQLYNQIQIDNLCTTKLKANGASIAIPSVSGTSIGILPITKTHYDVKDSIRMDKYAPIQLIHGKQIYDFEFGSGTTNIIASTTKSDNLVRIWDIPKTDVGEYDMVKSYLAGHDKRVEIMAFHPTCEQVIATASIDQTIKLWNINRYEEMMTMDSVNAAIPSNMIFRAQGDLIICGMNDATVQLFDPRNHNFPIKVWPTEHAPNKGMKVCQVNMTPYILTSGFDKHQRELRLFDLRNLSFLEKYTVPETGVGILQPTCDAQLPVVYATSKGEGIRVFELDDGHLKFISILKLEKQYNTGTKTVLMIRNDKTIDMNSIYVPRRAEDNYFNHDQAYPPLTISPIQNSEEWFTDDFNPIVAIEEEKPLSVHGSTKKNVSREPSKSKPMKRGYIELEKVYWTSSEWIKCWVVLSSKRFYMGTNSDQFCLTPLSTLETLINIRGCNVNQLIFEFNIGKTLYRWKTNSKEDRDEWVTELQSHQKKQVSSNLLLPDLPKPTVDESSVLLGIMDTIVNVDENAGKWVKNLVVLNSNNTIDIYPPDMNKFMQKMLPIHMLDLSLALMVRKSQGSDTSFTIQCATRAAHFKMKDSSDINDWLNQINSSLPETHKLIFEGPVNVRAPFFNINEKKLNSCWITLIDETFTYFHNQFSVQALGSFNVDDITMYDEMLPDIVKTNADSISIGLMAKNWSLEHQFSNIQSQQSFATILDDYRLSNSDFFVKFCDMNGETLLPMIESAKTMKILHVDGITILDEQKLLSGVQMLLIKIEKEPISGRWVVYSVDCHVDSLNSIATFILDNGNLIYHWTGADATLFCRAEGLNLGASIRKHRGCRPVLKICEDEDKNELRKRLGSDTYVIRKLEDGILPLAIYTPTDAPIMKMKRLIRSTYLGIEPSKKLLKDLCLIHFRNEVFIWFGIGSVSHPRKWLIYFAAQCLIEKLKKQFSHVMYSEEFEGRETALFKSKFIDFPSDLPISMKIDATPGNIAKAADQKPIDIDAMLLIPELTIPNTSFQTVSLNMYVIKGFEKAPIQKEKYGSFSTLESYVIVHTYLPPQSSVEKRTIFFWQGLMATIVNKGTSALISVDVSQESNSQSNQIRIVEGKEPVEFFRALNAKTLLITSPELAQNDVRIFDIRQYIGELCRAIEISPKDTQMHQSHSLLFVFPNQMYAWHGSNSTKYEVESVQHIINILGVKDVRVKKLDGAEWDSELLKYLSGKNIAKPVSAVKRETARLYRFSSVSGVMEVLEIMPFSQEDLISNSVCSLVTSDTVYVWFGYHSSTSDQKTALTIMKVR